jgi:ribosomal protein S10
VLLMTFCNVYPTYCPNCQKLIFIGKHQNHTLYAIDYDKSNWLRHACTNDNSHIFQNELIIEYINENNPDQAIPFQFIKSKKDYKRKILRPGVVLAVEKDHSHNLLLDVITVDNKFLIVKVYKSEIEILPGHILDLKAAIRTGTNKFRLPEVKLIEIPSENFDEGRSLLEFYKIKITFEDQEKLELVIDRVIHHAKQQQISIFGIVPLPINRQEHKSMYSRMIYVIPTDEMLKKIQLLHIPDEYDISVEQIKIKSNKSN